MKKVVMESRPPFCFCSDGDGDFLPPPPAPPPVFQLPPPPLDAAWLDSVADSEVLGLPRDSQHKHCSSLLSTANFSDCGLLQEYGGASSSSHVWVKTVAPVAALVSIVVLVAAVVITMLHRRKRDRSRRAVLVHKTVGNAAGNVTSAGGLVTGNSSGNSSGNSMYHSRHHDSGRAGGRHHLCHHHHHRVHHHNHHHHHLQPCYHVTADSLTKSARCERGALERVAGSSDCALIPLRHASSSLVYEDSDNASNVYEEIPCLGVGSHYRSTVSSPLSSGSPMSAGVTAAAATTGLSNSMVLGATPTASPRMLAVGGGGGGGVYAASSDAPALCCAGSRHEHMYNDALYR